LFAAAITLAACTTFTAAPSDSGGADAGADASPDVAAEAAASASCPASLPFASTFDSWKPTASNAASPTAANVAGKSCYSTDVNGNASEAYLVHDIPSPDVTLAFDVYVSDPTGSVGKSVTVTIIKIDCGSSQDIALEIDGSGPAIAVNVNPPGNNGYDSFASSSFFDGWHRFTIDIKGSSVTVGVDASTYLNPLDAQQTFTGRKCTAEVGLKAYQQSGTVGALEACFASACASGAF
jgi:hypothetical protein